MASAQPLFLRACRGEPTERRPLWLMRQAGRYLPEYREVRAQISFLDLCKHPELACEVTLQPIRRFGFDAAILFSDILVPVEAMGCPVVFPDPGGPMLPQPVRVPADIERLRVPDPAAEMPFVLEALRRVRAALAPATALIGFAGAPVTLASYMVEGGSSKNFTLLKGLLHGAPAAARLLLGKLADTVALYLAAQVEAGAQAVQLFDTWAGMLAPDDYSEFALPYTAQIVSALRARSVPVIVYVNGGGTLLERVARTGCDVVGLDWRIDIAEARARLGPERPVQGNLDPCVLLSTPEVVARKARTIGAAAGARGHIFNLGHGVLPETPLASVEALVEAVRGLP
ncbi:MAG TPA: uroporphyrinogen decarboxylase [Polyangia bacterium]|nr:uroporphyrinogen decarboxylase [Polyangia bacterium]